MNETDIFKGLRYIDDDIIEEAEFGVFSVKVGSRTIRRPLLVAAIITLALMLVGCAVVYVLSMNGIRLGEQTEKRDVFEFDPKTGEAVAYIGQESYTEQVFTIAGLHDSPSNQAAQEWFAFIKAYDPDNAIRNERWGTEMNFPEAYDSYHIYTDEMKEKVDEICQKFGLKLAGKQMDFKTSVNVCDALGIQSIQSSEHGLFFTFGNAKCWEQGNFYLEFDVAYPEKTETELSDTYGTLHWNRKDCFSDDVITYEDNGDWREWEYTTTSGHKAVITSSQSDSRGYIICDRGEAVMSIMVEDQWTYGEGPDWNTLYLSDRQMEQLVDAIDAAIQPKMPTQENLDSQV